MSPPQVFDRSVLRQRRRRARARGPATSRIDRVPGALADRLAAVLRPFGLAADLGSPTGAVRRALAARVGTMVAVDASAPNLADHDGPKVVADEEALPFAEASLDLVVSGLALQSVNDLPGAPVAARPPP